MLREDINMNDSAKLALLHFNANNGRIEQALAAGEHGRRLTELGFARDIDYAAEIDLFDLAPRYRDGRVALEAAS